MRAMTETGLFTPLQRESTDTAAAAELVTGRPTAKGHERPATTVRPKGSCSRFAPRC